ncbi:MAG: hypothetical protein ACRYHQ_06605, partial [Janthinobacterium lividum]
MNGVGEVFGIPSCPFAAVFQAEGRLCLPQRVSAMCLTTAMSARPIVDGNLSLGAFWRHPLRLFSMEEHIAGLMQYCRPGSSREDAGCDAAKLHAVALSLRETQGCRCAGRPERPLDPAGDPLGRSGRRRQAAKLRPGQVGPHHDEAEAGEAAQVH